MICQIAFQAYLPARLWRVILPFKAFGLMFHLF